MPVTDRHQRLCDTRLYLVATVPPVAKGADPPAFWWTALEASVRGGATAVQLRFKGATTADRIQLARKARQLLGEQPLLIVNDDLEAALDDAVDGLHLGRDDAVRLLVGPERPSDTAVAIRRLFAALPQGLHARFRLRAVSRLGFQSLEVWDGLALARQRLGPERLLGTSTRNCLEVELALRAGADHMGFGAMAPTRTKDDTRPASPAELAHCARRFPTAPLFPIGGLGPRTLGPVLDAGVARAAVGSALLDAADPWAVAAELVRMLGTARPPRRLPPEEADGSAERG